MFLALLVVNRNINQYVRPSFWSVFLIFSSILKISLHLGIGRPSTSNHIVFKKNFEKIILWSDCWHPMAQLWRVPQWIWLKLLGHLLILNKLPIKLNELMWVGIMLLLLFHWTNVGIYIPM